MFESVKWSYIAKACGWISCGFAIYAAITITRSASPLWFFIIPAVAAITGDRRSGSDE